MSYRKRVSVKTYEDDGCRIDLGNLEATSGFRNGYEAKIKTNLYEGHLRDGNASLSNTWFETSANAKADHKGLYAGVDFTVTKVESKIHTKAGRLDSSISLNAKTGVKYGLDGASVKVAGFGIDVGSRMGVSTPFGEIGWDFTDRS